MTLEENAINKFQKIAIFLIAIYLYFFLVDKFQVPDFRNSVRQFFVFENSTSHTILEWMKTTSNQLSGILSISVVPVFYVLPVKIFLKKLLFYFKFELNFFF
jgi:hypothetical protein